MCFFSMEVNDWLLFWHASDGFVEVKRENVLEWFDWKGSFAKLCEMYSVIKSEVVWWGVTNDKVAVGSELTRVGAFLLDFYTERITGNINCHMVSPVWSEWKLQGTILIDWSDTQLIDQRLSW